MDGKSLSDLAFRILVGNAWNKAGLGLVALGATSLTGWVDKLVKHFSGGDWSDPAEYVGWLFIAIGISLLGVGAWKTKPPNPHDFALIRRFRALFTAGDIDFLTNHNFYANWHDSRTASIEDLADDWIGAQEEFVDKKLNKLLKAVKVLSRELAGMMEYSFGLGSDLRVRTFKTDPDRAGRVSAQTMTRIENANNVARRLAEAINKLERAAKERLLDA